jgi:hypothetical protein
MMTVFFRPLKSLPNSEKCKIWIYLPYGYVFFQATPHGQILPIAAKILKQDTLAQPGAFEDFVKGRTYVINHKLSHFNSKMFQKKAVFRIRIQIRTGMFLVLLDPDPPTRKKLRKTVISAVFFTS